jgi:hypothetical protein
MAVTVCAPCPDENMYHGAVRAGAGTLNAAIVNDFVGTNNRVYGPPQDFWNLGAGKYPGDGANIANSSDGITITTGDNVTVDSAVFGGTGYLINAIDRKTGGVLTVAPGGSLVHTVKLRIVADGKATMSGTAWSIAGTRMVEDDSVFTLSSGVPNVTDVALGRGNTALQSASFIISRSSASVTCDNNFNLNQVLGLRNVVFNFDSGGISPVFAKKDVVLTAAGGTDVLNNPMDGYRLNQTYFSQLQINRKKEGKQ